ncbi:MAG: DUF4249 family protein [Cyclobacteriaceae bacterium]
MKRFPIVILLVVLASCVTEFDPKLPSAPKRLVIEGRITNDPGPYSVKLSQTEDIDFFFRDSLFAPARNAVVTLAEENGVSETLIEMEPGLYKTQPDGIQGETGKRYQLTVITGENNVYQSPWEEMLPVQEIDSLFFEFEEEETKIMSPFVPQSTLNIREFFITDPLNVFVEDVSQVIGVGPEWFGVSGEIIVQLSDVLTSDHFVFVDNSANRGLRLKLSSSDAAESTDFYIWDVRGVFEVNTQPQNFVLSGSGGGAHTRFVSIPKDCCKKCWVEFDHSSLFISDDQLFDGNNFTVETAFFPIAPNNMVFNRGLYVEVEQASINREAFLFHKNIDRQINNVGGLFDAAPGLATSNLVNQDDPDDYTLGYFVVSSVRTKSTFISREEIPGASTTFIYSDDCRELTGGIFNSTTERPNFWPL